MYVRVWHLSRRKLLELRGNGWKNFLFLKAAPTEENIMTHFKTIYISRNDMGRGGFLWEDLDVVKGPPTPWHRTIRGQWGLYYHYYYYFKKRKKMNHCVMTSSRRISKIRFVYSARLISQMKYQFLSKLWQVVRNEVSCLHAEHKSPHHNNHC